jgi:DNA-binding transcriptional MocR family regulator
LIVDRALDLPLSAQVVDQLRAAMRSGRLAAWRRAWRLAATTPPAARPDPRGLPELRVELAEYMRRGRGVICPPERVLVTRGATNGLDLLAATVLRPGGRVGVEEPGYGDARSVLAARGARLVPCPVDGHGVVMDSLARHYAGPPAVSGLVIGYGAERLSALRPGCARVRALLRAARRAR